MGEIKKEEMEDVPTEASGEALMGVQNLDQGDIESYNAGSTNLNRGNYDGIISPYNGICSTNQKRKTSFSEMLCKS